MARKKKKLGKYGKGIFVIASIALLNLTGITYAQWNDRLELFSTLSTGELNILFGNEEKTFHFDASMDKKGELSVPYKIVDKSSMPAELIGFELLNTNEKMITISENNEEPQLNNSTTEASIYDYYLKLNIHPSKPGEYDYKVKLTYQQKEKDK